MAFHAKYWSCTKFADWLRGTPKPMAATSKEWRIWRNEAAKNTFRYWLAEEGLDYLQDFLYSPYTLAHKITYYFKLRFVDKTHICRTGLKPGQFHETDTRILHGMFEELRYFVEDQEAWMYNVFDKDTKAPWYKTKWPFRHLIRTNIPEHGIAHLEWASNLTMNDEWFGVYEDSTPEEKERAKANPNYGKPTHQAEVAREILSLYKWWTEVRPNRPDPYDASGWTKLCEEKRGEDRDNFFETDIGAREREALDICNKIEHQYEEEDEANMIRLIKIRRGLWT